MHRAYPLNSAQHARRIEFTSFLCPLAYKSLLYKDSDADLRHPLISYDSEGLGDDTRLMQELGVSFDEGLESIFGHVGAQIVEHAALAEQGMGAGLDGVGLEVAVHAEALAGGAEQGEQDDSERIEQQQQSVAPLRIADANRREAHAEAQVLGISETGLHSPPFRVEPDDLRRGRVTI